MINLSVPLYGGSTETEVYTYLINTVGLNKAAAVGVLANIYHESRFDHTALGDMTNGQYTSYGLCQWHDDPLGSGRWTNLKNYCKNNNLAPNTLKGQLAYLYYELRNSYATLLELLKEVGNNAQGCWYAAAHWCARFEVPQGYGSWDGGVLTLGSTSISRGNFARDTYWKAYEGVPDTATVTPTVNKGSMIVEEAKKYLGTPYLVEGETPSGFDSSGFVYYVYDQSIDYEWERTSAHIQWRDHGREVSNLSAGDLIFFKDTADTGNDPNISHVGIATGNGDEFIHASPGEGVILSNLSEDYYKSHYHSTHRLLSNSETSSRDNTPVANSSSSLTYASVNIYNEEIESTLTYIEESNETEYQKTGRRYGYILDIVNGGEFKFIVPEYDVSVQANWDTVNILGRSAEIKGYNSTASRSIDVNLELFAGEGLYTGKGDYVSKLHSDIAFLQSLAYPDYSKAIILPPPLVVLYLGPTLKMKGILENVRVKYLKPYDTRLRPMRAEVSFGVTHITDSPPDYYDVRNHSFEGARSGFITSYGDSATTNDSQEHSYNLTPTTDSGGLLPTPADQNPVVLDTGIFSYELPGNLPKPSTPTINWDAVSSGNFNNIIPKS